MILADILSLISQAGESIAKAAAALDQLKTELEAHPQIDGAASDAEDAATHNALTPIPGQS